MPRFHIQPVNLDLPATEFIAHNDAAVLHAIERMAVPDAHVERDGHYAFSVRLDSNGAWYIYHRETVQELTVRTRMG